MCEFHGEGHSPKKVVHPPDSTAVESSEPESKRKERAALQGTIKLFGSGAYSNAEGAEEFERAIRILGGEEPLKPESSDQANADARSQEEGDGQIDTSVQKLPDTVTALDPVFANALTAPAL